MTRLLVILIALLVAWMWIARMVRGLLRSPRAAEARSFLRLFRMLQRSASGTPGARTARRAAGASSHGPASRTASGAKPASALRRCGRCGVHVPEARLTAGVCGACTGESEAG